MRPLLTYLVEDSPVIRDNLIATLEELAPVQVVGWAEGEMQALAWLAGQAVDLVIVDLFLADGSGLGVLRHAQQFGNRACHVVLSNYVTAPMRSQCLALGAKAVFDKSTEIEGLLDWCQAHALTLPPGASPLPGSP